jgi:hypothetical protein
MRSIVWLIALLTALACAVSGQAAKGSDPALDDADHLHAADSGAEASTPSGTEPHCAALGQSCAHDDCCEGSCDQSLCVASNATTCAALGQSCQTQDCCSGVCEASVCVEHPSCVPPGGDCSNRDCCGGSCSGSICQ